MNTKESRIHFYRNYKTAGMSLEKWKPTKGVPPLPPARATPHTVGHRVKGQSHHDSYKGGTIAGGGWHILTTDGVRMVVLPGPKGPDLGNFTEPREFITVDGTSLFQLVKRMAITNPNSVQLCIEPDKIQVQAEDVDTGEEAFEWVDCRSSITTSLIINPKLLTDCLSQEAWEFGFESWRGAETVIWARPVEADWYYVCMSMVKKGG